MKVLFISSWYPTDENPITGIFVKEHAKAIKSVNVDIIVLAIIAIRDNSMLKVVHKKYIDESKIETHQILIKSRFRDVFHHLIPYQQYITYRYCKKYIFKNFKPDIIHSNVIFPAGIIGDYISKKIHKPLVITEHWSKIASFLKKPYISHLGKLTYKHAAKILPVSKYLKSNIKSLLPELETDKFQVIPNVISSDIFKYEPKKLNNDEIHFCAIATWATKKEPDKYPELFIEALSEFQKTNKQTVTLTIIGGGDKIPGLKKLCQKLSVKTHFTGPLSKKEIATILQTSDYFLHASRIETFGIVAIEALMTGTPAICSNVGGLPELINSTNGILCDNNIEDWTAAINKISHKTYSNESIAKQTAEKYSYIAVGTEIYYSYKSILD
ncbi:MAG: glycosyltransferase [Paludibacter sp.]|nr:glycosyltransferase [Paludibacter sp.]